MRHRYRTWLLVVFSASGLLIASTAAQRAGGSASPPIAREVPLPPQTGTGLISGVVADLNTGQPIRRANVTLRNTDTNASAVDLTDDEGRFEFPELPAGRFTVLVSKPAYVGIAYGARSLRVPGITIALAGGQRVTDINMAIAKGAVLTGRLVDQGGQPATQLRVAAAERTVVNGEASFRAITGATTTDDRGIYRIFGLAAGAYVLSAMPSPGSMLGGGAARATTAEEVQWAGGSATTRPGVPLPNAPPRGQGLRFSAVYYPGTAEPAAAVPISVAAGEERSGLDFVVPLVPTATLEGIVTRADGQPIGSGVQIMPLATATVAMPGLIVLPPRATVTPDGKFSVVGLTPGHYVLTARASSAGPALAPPGGRGPAAPTMDLWATADVSVAGRDISNLTLTLMPGMKISGRVVVESIAGQPPPDMGRATIRITAPPGNAATMLVPSSTADADGSFTLSGVPPGSFYLSASLPGGTPANPTWILKSGVVNGQDVLDTPLEVRPNEQVTNVVMTLSDRVTQLSGSLTDQLGRPVPTHFVIVFSTNPAHWRQQSRWIRVPARPATDGRFSIAGLPAGEYYLAALTEFEQNEWHTPPFLQQLVPMALKVTLAEGERKTQDIRLASR